MPSNLRDSFLRNLILKNRISATTIFNKGLANRVDTAVFQDSLWFQLFFLSKYFSPTIKCYLLPTVKLPLSCSVEHDVARARIQKNLNEVFRRMKIKYFFYPDSDSRSFTNTSMAKGAEVWVMPRAKEGTTFKSYYTGKLIAQDIT